MNYSFLEQNKSNNFVDNSKNKANINYATNINQEKYNNWKTENSIHNSVLKGIYEETPLGQLFFTEENINDMIELTDNIQLLEFKNPVCLIFGYFVYSKGVIVDKNKLEHVKHAIPKFNDYFEFVHLQDIVRYARLWDISLNK